MSGLCEFTDWNFRSVTNVTTFSTRATWSEQTTSRWGSYCYTPWVECIASIWRTISNVIESSETGIYSGSLRRLTSTYHEEVRSNESEFEEITRGCPRLRCKNSPKIILEVAISNRFWDTCWWCLPSSITDHWKRGRLKNRRASSARGSLDMPRFWCLKTVVCVGWIVKDVRITN
jgi:hypothetical protein